jgi:hypothetical protein
MDRRRRQLVALVVLFAAVGAVGAATFSYSVDNGVTYAIQNDSGDLVGPEVNIDAATTPTASEPFPNDRTVDLGNVSYASDDAVSVTVGGSDITGPRYVVRSISQLGSEPLEVSNGTQRVDVSGSITRLEFEAVDLSDTQTTEVSVQGSGDVTVHNFTSGERVRVNRANSADTVETADSQGRVNISVSNGADLTFVKDAAPTVSDPTPTGTITQTPVELSVNLSHGDFDAGETVTLNWTHNGNVVANQTHSSAGNKTVTVSDTEAGSNSYQVTAKDSDGETATLSATYKAPGEIQIRDETDPDQLITDNVSFRVRFFFDGGSNVVERSADNGSVDLTGLPVDERIVISVAEENNNYTFRRILIDSIVETQSIYLLPANASSSEIRFQLDDQTGRFDPQNTALFIEKPLNRSNSTSYEIISGDVFGSDGEFPTSLVDDTRYRLRVVSPTGEERVLGAYQVSGPDVAVLPIGEIKLEGAADSGATMQASLRDAAANAAHDHEIRVYYIDRSEQTSEFDLEIVTSSGQTIRAKTTETGPFGTYAETFPISNTSINPKETTIYVRLDASRNGETQSFEEPLGDLPPLADGWGIDSDVLEMIGWLSLLALTGFVVIVSSTLAALVAVLYAALLTALGILPIPAVALGVAGSVAGLYRVGDSR